jgi:hypothetical protein
MIFCSFVTIQVKIAPGCALHILSSKVEALERVHSLFWDSCRHAQYSSDSSDCLQLGSKCQSALESRSPRQSDPDHVATISRERIDINRRTRYEETRNTAYTRKICVSVENHREKAGYHRIKPKRKTLRETRSTRQTEVNSGSRDFE